MSETYAPAEMRLAMRLAESGALFDRPLVILSAPRSGSALLYELLARSRALWSIGGESHAIIEDLVGLDPTGVRVRSNRLTAVHALPEVVQVVRAGFAIAVRNAAGTRLVAMSTMARPTSLRFVEKTPKNMLRVPFMRAVFPTARFVLLVRDPREALSSMIEAWESEKFVTYPKLPGIDGPWSLLLPDGYEALAGCSVEERAAFQWGAANRTALDDLTQVPRAEWCVVSYAELVAEPARLVRRIARLAELDLSDLDDIRDSSQLPVSTHTLSPPRSGKWQRHANRIARVLPQLEAITQRLAALQGEAVP